MISLLLSTSVKTNRYFSRSNPITYIKAYDDIRNFLPHNKPQNWQAIQPSIFRLMSMVVDVKAAREKVK
ncbi:MAG: hypothetical protein CM15mP83_9250 [Flavobacteriaceae bacterium]|nr:MAG: hypothetical protein CM15mP83_9250 [Flavobacteriaceae bacterium]